MQIIIAILALSFLIIVHELGHFAVAKLSGIKVLEFSLFMGPQLFSVKKGETVYSIRLVPLGGFVRMEGEEQASDDARAFNRQPILTRVAVIAAGPIMNLLVALVIVLILNASYGYKTNVISEIDPTSPAKEAGLQVGDEILNYAGKNIYYPTDVFLFLFGSKGSPNEITVKRGDTVETLHITPEIIQQNRYILGFNPMASYGPGWNEVANVEETSAAYKGGMRKGDKILRMNETPVNSNREIRKYLKENGGQELTVWVQRDGKEVDLKITPMMDKNEEQYDLGIDFQGERGSFSRTALYSLRYVYSIGRNVYYSLGWLVTGRASLNQLTGPIGIVSTIGTVVEKSPTFADKLVNLLGFVSLISINLGLFNLIPFPALDGSKLLLLGVEGIRRKALSPEKEAFISLVGFVILIMLMIFTMYNDIYKLATGG